MVQFESKRYVYQYENGDIKIKSDGVLKTYLVFRRNAPSLISGKVIDITYLLKCAHRTKKINFYLEYNDGSQLDFIPVGKTRLYHRGDLKILKKISAGVAATQDQQVFSGGYGLSYIKASIPTPVYDYIIDNVIASIQNRKDLALDSQWKKRLDNQTIRKTRRYTYFWATMYGSIPVINDIDVTGIIKSCGVQASGLGRIGVRLIRVHNPDRKAQWNLGFTIRRLDAAEFTEI